MKAVTIFVYYAEKRDHWSVRDRFLSSPSRSTCACTRNSSWNYFDFGQAIRESALEFCLFFFLGHHVD